MPPNEILYVGVVFLAALLLVLSEIIKTFGNNSLEAFGNRWTWALIVLSIGTAALVYWVIRSIPGTGQSPLLTAVTVGLAYPFILRSRLTYFREIGKKGDDKSTLTFKVFDEIYTRLQDRCLQAVHADLALGNLRKSRAVASKTSEAQLEKEITHLLSFQKLEDLRAIHQKRLDEALAVGNEELRKIKLAEVLVEMTNGDPDRLLRRG